MSLLVTAACAETEVDSGADAGDAAIAPPVQLPDAGTPVPDASAPRPPDSGVFVPPDASTPVPDAGPRPDASAPSDASTPEVPDIFGDGGFVPPPPADPEGWTLNSDSAKECPAEPPPIPIIGGLCTGIYFGCGWTNTSGATYSCVCDWVHWLCI